MEAEMEVQLMEAEIEAQLIGDVSSKSCLNVTTEYLEVPKLTSLAARKVLKNCPDYLKIIINEYRKTLPMPWVRKIGTIFGYISGESYYVDTLRGFFDTFPQFVFPVPMERYDHTQYRRYFRKNDQKYYISTEYISDPITNDEIITFFTERKISLIYGIEIGL